MDSVKKSSSRSSFVSKNSSPSKVDKPVATKDEHKASPDEKPLVSSLGSAVSGFAAAKKPMGERKGPVTMGGKRDPKDLSKVASDPQKAKDEVKKEEITKEEGKKKKEDLKNINEGSSIEEVEGKLEEEKGFWSKFKKFFTKKNAGIVWKRVLNIARSLKIAGPLEIIESIINITKGDKADFHTFFRTLGMGLKGGVSNFLHNWLANLLKIGASCINVIMPEDCELTSLQLVPLLQWVLKFFRADKLFKYVYAVVQKKPSGFLEFAQFTLKGIGDSLLKVIQPSNLIKAIGGSLFSLLKNNAIVGMVTKYLGYGCKMLGGITNCVAACLDGSTDVIAKALEDALLELPKLILDIVCDVFSPGFVDTIKGAIEQFRDTIDIFNVLKWLGVDEAGKVKGLGKNDKGKDFDVAIIGDSLSEAKDPAFGFETEEEEEEEEKKEADKKSDASKGKKEESGHGVRNWVKKQVKKVGNGIKKTGKKALDKTKGAMLDDDLIKAARGKDGEGKDSSGKASTDVDYSGYFDLKEAEGRKKAAQIQKENEAAGFTVEFVVAGKQLPEIKDEDVPAAMLVDMKNKGIAFKGQKAHMAHYVVYKDGKAIYRTPIPERAEEAIREAQGKNKSDLKDDLLAQALGVEAYELGNQGEGKRGFGEYMLNAVKVTGKAMGKSDDDDD